MRVRPKPGGGLVRLVRLGGVSVLSTVLPASPVAERGRPGRDIWSFWLAGVYYLLAAVVVTMWLWRDPASRIAAVNPYDSDQSAWFFRYDATAVAHLHLPALITTAMNAPQGVNLMWNTPMPLLGVLLAPLTLLAGPQSSLTVAMTLGFAGSALAMFGVLRRWDVSTAAAAAGGLIYGFSPALVQSSLGHYDLQFAVFPPLIVNGIARLATGRCGPGRRAALRCGGWLGLVMAAQIFVTEELLFDSVVAAVILVAAGAVSRPRAVAGRIGDAAAGVAATAGVTLVIAGYPLWEQFFGPLRQYGSPFAPDLYKNDLAGFVQPSAAMLLHTHASAAFAANFQGQPPEYLAYLGWPMLIVLAAVAVWCWRLLAVRAAAVTFAVLEVFSLGGTLLGGGHEHSWVKLPWYWLQTLPVIGSAIPDRFSIVADGAAAAIFAFGIDAARARLPAARWPAARWAVAAVALVAIAPLVPRPLPAGSVSAVPAGWAATFAALRLPAGARVLVVPVAVSTFTEPLRWQADTGVPSSMVGGYYMGPNRSGHAATDGSGLSLEGLYLNRLWALGSGGATGAGRRPSQPRPDPAQMRAQLAAWNPDAVVAVTSDQSALGRYLTRLLGPPSAGAGGVLGWRLRPDGAPAGHEPRLSRLRAASPHRLGQGEPCHDDHHQRGQAGDPPQRQDPQQPSPPCDGQRRHRPQRQYAPDAHRHRVVVSGSEVRDHDVRQVTQLSQRDHPERGSRHGPEPGSVGLQPGFILVVLICAQYKHRAGQEDHGHHDLQDPVREQTQQAAARDRQHHVHRERRRRPGEYPARPVPGTQHQARQPGVVRQLGSGDRPENYRGDEQA